SFALTMLEWNRQDIIVSRADLGDMQGQELCTILRDDPGMKELRFALVAGPDELSSATGSEGIDVIVPATMSAAATATRIIQLMPDVTPLPVDVPPQAVETSAAAAAAPHAPSQSFAGSLDSVDLSELTREIARAGRTGHLLVAFETAGGVVAFEAGRVVH